MTTLHDLEQHIDEFDFIDEDNQVVLSVHLEASFYFWQGHTPQLRDSLKACIDHYMQLFGEHITWGLDPLGGWRAKPIQKLPTFEKVLKKLSHHDDAIEWFVASDGINDTIYPNPYQISCLTARAWQIEEISVLNFRIHRADFFDETKRLTIMQLFYDCIAKLNPYHALMGWASAFGYAKAALDIDILEQAKMFYGINVYDIWDTVQLHHGIRTIDWLTYISDELAESVGGRTRFERQLLQQAINYQALDNGILLIASDTPAILPIDEPIPDSYLTINTLCRPMRNGNFGSIGSGYDEGVGYQGFNNYFTDLWMRRFDKPQLWRDFPQVLPSFPTPAIRLQTEDICQISGRYRYETEYDYHRDHPVYVEDPTSRINDYRQYIILLKGDIAPFYSKRDNHGKVLERMSIIWQLFEIL